MDLRDLMFIHSGSSEIVLGPNLFDISSFEGQTGITVEGNTFSGNASDISAVAFSISEAITSGEKYRLSFTVRCLTQVSDCSIALRSHTTSGYSPIIIIYGEDADVDTYFETDITNSGSNSIDGFQFGYSQDTAWKIEDLSIQKIIEE